MQKILLLFFTLLVLTKNITYCQSITIDNNSIGLIVLDDTMYNGTGFNLLQPNYIVTCAHVIDTTKSISFVALNSYKPFKLKVIKYDIDNDLALLECNENICKTPLNPAPKFAIYPSQHLFYLGYNTLISTNEEKKLQVDNASVSAVGKVQSGKTVVDFIEFRGVGVPGYSGGPVFNDKGQVVAVMREAWLKQGVKGGQIVLINRAFSIGPIIR